MLSKAPNQVNSVASRCRCGICGATPDVVATGIDPVTIKASCCGQSEVRNVKKEDLFFTQVFFSKEDGEQA